MFDAKEPQHALKEALDGLFSHAERERRRAAGSKAASSSSKTLRSLVKDRDGLSVFLDRPEVPMDR